jgi:alpha-L-fucosidase 2
MMGSLVWGDGRPLRISLDRADLWDARLVPEFSGPDYKFDVMQRWHREGRVADLLRISDLLIWVCAFWLPAGNSSGSKTLHEDL